MNRILECMGPTHGAGKALADYLHISPNVITNWKNGSNRSYRKYIKQIADYFGVSVDYLLGYEEKENPTTTEKSGLEDLLKDEFITFYGTIKSHLSEKDIEELTSLINTKVEINKRITIKKKTEKK